jgi:hypothetical protein
MNVKLCYRARLNDAGLYWAHRVFRESGRPWKRELLNALVCNGRASLSSSPRPPRKFRLPNSVVIRVV